MEEETNAPEKEKEKVMIPVVKEIRDEHSNRYRKVIVWEEKKEPEKK